jgi:hypothetical protein
LEIELAVFVFFGAVFFFMIRYWMLTFPLVILLTVGIYVYNTPGRIAKADVEISQVIIEGGDALWSVGYKINNRSSDYAVTDLHFVCDGNKDTDKEADLDPGIHTGVLRLGVVDAASTDKLSYCVPVYNMRRVG